MKLTINRKLKAVRILQGMTQGDLAKRVGRSQAWIWRLERGLQIPTDIDIALLCRALKVRPEEIFPSPPTAAAANFSSENRR